jgi:hypothetical protein
MQPSMMRGVPDKLLAAADEVIVNLLHLLRTGLGTKQLQPSMHPRVEFASACEAIRNSPAMC